MVVQDRRCANGLYAASRSTAGGTFARERGARQVFARTPRRAPRRRRNRSARDVYVKTGIRGGKFSKSGRCRNRIVTAKTVRSVPRDARALKKPRFLEL